MEHAVHLSATYEYNDSYIVNTIVITEGVRDGIVLHHTQVSFKCREIHSHVVPIEVHSDMLCFCGG